MISSRHDVLRPRPTSEGIETKPNGTPLQSAVTTNPDPAPPPRGLKPVQRGLEPVAVYNQPDPAPPPRGLKRNRAMDLGVIDGRDMKSPTPPHLRGD